MIEKEMFIKNGKVIRADDVYLDPRDATIEAQAAEIERLKNSVRFPTSEEEAVAMFIISERWLRKNAPHRFTAHEVLGETE
jgi:hypothetical protein